MEVLPEKLFFEEGADDRISYQIYEKDGPLSEGHADIAYQHTQLQM